MNTRRHEVFGESTPGQPEPPAARAHHSTEISIKIAGDLGVITLKGGLFVTERASLQTHLQTLLHSTSHVLMDCRELTEMDATCLLLLCQTNRDSIKLMKRITAFGVKPVVFRAATTLATARYARGCPGTCEGDCLWTSVAD